MLALRDGASRDRSRRLDPPSCAIEVFRSECMPKSARPAAADVDALRRPREAVVRMRPHFPKIVSAADRRRRPPPCSSPSAGSDSPAMPSCCSGAAAHARPALFAGRRSGRFARHRARAARRVPRPRRPARGTQRFASRCARTIAAPSSSTSAAYRASQPSPTIMPTAPRPSIREADRAAGSTARLAGTAAHEFVSSANAIVKAARRDPASPRECGTRRRPTRIDDMTWVILTGRQSDLDQVGDAAQDHHQPRLSRASGAVSRPAAEGDQPVQQLRLPEPRLLRLAAGRFARPQGHPDGRDDDRPVGAQALRARAAGTGAGAQQMPQGSRRRLPAKGRRSSSASARRRPGTVSPSCCSTGSARRRWRSRSRTAREWASIRKIGFLPLARMSRRGEEALPGRPGNLHQPRMARHQGAHAGALHLRHAGRSARGTAAVGDRVAALLGQDRRKDGRRGRADHQEGSGQARQLRRAVHPRDDVDLQPHLPLRAPRPAGRHAGHRRSAVDDPLHQQGLSQRADGLQQGAGAADGDDRRHGRSSKWRRRRSAFRWC